MVSISSGEWSFINASPSDLLKTGESSLLSHPPSLSFFQRGHRRSQITVRPSQRFISLKPMSSLKQSNKETGIKCCDCVPFNHRKSDGSQLKESSSPEIRCKGQIKRNKVASTENKGPPKSFKLKKFFLAKNPSRRNSEKLDDNLRIISIVHSDPPLPVPKPVIKDRNKKESLWERRCGQSLKGLQVQRTQVKRQQLQQKQLQQQQESKQVWELIEKDCNFDNRNRNYSTRNGSIRSQSKRKIKVESL